MYLDAGDASRRGLLSVQAVHRNCADRWLAAGARQVEADRSSSTRLRADGGRIVLLEGKRGTKYGDLEQVRFSLANSAHLDPNSRGRSSAGGTTHLGTCDRVDERATAGYLRHRR